MSRPGRVDERLSESHKQLARDREARVRPRSFCSLQCAQSDVAIQISRQAYTLDQQERKIFELTNGLNAIQNTLKECENQLRAAQADVVTRDKRLLALAQRFGHESVEDAETVPLPPSNAQLAEDLKAARAKLSKLSSRERQYHEAQVETLARVEEAEAQVARLEHQLGALQETERAHQQRIRELEEAGRVDKVKINELEERLKTPPPAILADKENRSVIF
jgi:chromosome segregation ATPase